MTPPTSPTPDPDDTLERMRADEQHDWPTVLLRDVANAPLVHERDLREAIHFGPRDPDSPLTGAERRALQSAASGLTTAMTATVYGLDHTTIRNQLGRARFALGAKNTCHAVAVALRLGLIV